MKTISKNVLAVLVGIVVAGFLLDEAGKGKFGLLIQSGAKKVTQGFGV